MATVDAESGSVSVENTPINSWYNVVYKHVARRIAAFRPNSLRNMEVYNNNLYHIATRDRLKPSSEYKRWHHVWYHRRIWDSFSVTVFAMQPKLRFTLYLVPGHCV